MRTPCSCSPLCRTTSQPDYTFDDGAGHTYYANICGVSKHRCLPPDWLATYEIGVAVQFFGDVPPCDLTNPTMYCLEKNGQIPACCSADCQVQCAAVHVLACGRCCRVVGLPSPLPLLV